MSQTGGILRDELRRVWRDPAGWLVLVLLAIASAYAATTGARWAEQRQLAVDVAVAEADDIMAKRRETFASMVAKGEKPGFGLIYATALPFRAGLPNAPLALLSAGQAEGYPAAASISPFVDPWTIFDAHATGLENPAVLAAGRFDLAFVIILLMPLLLIACLYDFWSRDVESGSARFQLSQPVRPGKLIVSRALVHGGVLLGCMLAIILGSMLAVGAQGVADLGLVALVVLAYGAFWISLVILINIVVRNSTTAALASGTGWLLLVVLLPAFATALVARMAPPPSALTYTNAIRLAGLEVRASNLEEARRASTADSGRAYPETLWHRRRELSQIDSRLAPIHTAHFEDWAHHRSWSDRLRFLSPAVVAQDALDRIAGTDGSRAIAFQEQARLFAREARQLAFDWMDNDRLMTLADYDRDILTFAFVEPSRSGPLARDILALLLFTALLSIIIDLRLRGGALKLL